MSNLSAFPVMAVSSDDDLAYQNAKGGTRYSRMLAASKGETAIGSDDSDEFEDDEEEQESNDDLDDDEDKQDNDEVDEEQDEENEESGGPLVYTCDICPDKILKNETQVEVHLKSRAHRRRLRYVKKQEILQDPEKLKKKEEKAQKRREMAKQRKKERRKAIRRKRFLKKLAEKAKQEN